MSLLKKGNTTSKNIEFEEAITIKSFSYSDIDATPNQSLSSAAEKRGFIVVAALFFAILIAGAVLVHQNSFYAVRAENNITRSISVPAVRGTIYDRFNEPLLKNIPAYQLILLTSELPQERDERRKLFREIAEETELSIEDIESKIHEATNNYRNEVLLTRSIKNEQVISLRSKNITGLRIVDEVKRSYLDGEVFSHIVGYTGAVSEEDLKNDEIDLSINDIIGKNGLEAFYDQELRGLSGSRTLVKNIESRDFIDGGYEPPVPGNSLVTTIDAEFQKYFYNRLKRGLASLGRSKGLGVALNPQTGEILSLISLPGYDNNWFVNAHEYASEINKALVDERQPLFNRVVSGQYNPGSTIKPLVALAALEEDIVDPNKYFDDPGYLLVPNPYNPDAPSIFLDWREHGPVNMRKALAVSANVYFYIVGGGTDFQEGLGIERLIKYFKLFRIGEFLGVDLPGEKKAKIPQWNSDDREEPWRLGDTYNVSIGQGEFLVTPLELVNYIAAVGNGGTLYKPYIVDRILDPEGKEIANKDPEALVEGIAQEDNIEIVKEGMQDVVRRPYGTGYVLNSLPFSLAGKSGTAQVGNKETINALFTAFAPVENPEIALLVLVENAHEEGLNAVPVVEDVLLWYYTNRIQPKNN